MFDLEYAIAGVMLLALILYLLTGGADFGGGLWDLFAIGPRKKEQRLLIADAIAPIWEANHVWLIVVIVLLFVCFPSAYAVISTAFHIPLTLMLVGIVLRGTSFIFRSYNKNSPKTQKRWGLLFAISSIITPVMLGVVIGGISAGQVHIDPATKLVSTNFFSEWLRPFPFAVGFFTLALCAYLSALYLTLEASPHVLLQQDFRFRALIAGITSLVIAAIALALSNNQAPEIYQGIIHAPWSPGLPIIAGILGMSGLVCLFLRLDFAATTIGMAQTVVFMLGFGAAMFPYIIVPDLTILQAAAPESILKPVLIALGVGAVVLVPAFSYLYYVFKLRHES